MPEPEELNIDFSEPSEADLEEEAGFNEEGLEEEEKAEGKPEEEKPRDERGRFISKKADPEGEEAEPEEEKTEDEPEEESEEEKEAEPETAKAIAEARAKELLSELDEEEEEEEKPEPKPAVKEKETPSKKETTRMTKEVVARLLKRIDLDELPEGELIIGDTSINFREMAQDDPETFATNIALSGAIAEKTIGELLASGQLVTRSQMDGLLQSVSDQLNGFQFWLEVQQAHPDALKIKASKDFQTWIADQPKHIKALAASHNPEDTITFLNFYKEELAKEQVATKDKEDRSTKKKKDDLHKHTARTKTQVGGAIGKPGDKDDEEVGFHDDYEKHEPK